MRVSQVNPPNRHSFELCLEEEMAQDDNISGLMKWPMARSGSFKEKDHRQRLR